MHLIKSGFYLDPFPFCTFSTLRLNEQEERIRAVGGIQEQGHCHIQYAVWLNQTLMRLRLQEVITSEVQGCLQTKP